MDTNTNNTDNPTGLWAVSFWLQSDRIPTRTEIEATANAIGWKVDSVEPGGIALCEIDPATAATVEHVGWVGFESVGPCDMDIDIEAGETR